MVPVAVVRPGSHTSPAPPFSIHFNSSHSSAHLPSCPLVTLAPPRSPSFLHSTAPAAPVPSAAPASLTGISLAPADFHHFLPPAAAEACQQLPTVASGKAKLGSTSLWKKMQDQLWVARAVGVQGSKGGKAQDSQKSRWGGGIGRWVESKRTL